MNDSAPFTFYETAPRKPIKASPFVWRDPCKIPRRQWLYGSHYIREYLSVTVSPGGVGKSSLALVEVIAMITGRALVGIQPAEKIRAWYINLEDPLEEIERRIAAICVHYKIGPSELDGQLFVTSGRDTPVVVAVETKDGAKIVQPVVDELASEMSENRVSLLVVDPFVSSHEVSENDNNKINVVKDVFARIASLTSAAVELVHHTRKGSSGQGSEHTVDDARGAGALVFGARSARVLNGMTKEQGERAPVENPWLYFNVQNGKANLAPRSDKADWFRLVSVPLGNGGESPFDQGDSVGVVVKWEWPDPQKDVTVHHLREVQAAVAAGRWRENHQAKDWVGHAVARVLGLDMTSKAQKAVVLANIKIWLSSGMLAVVQGKDEKGNDRPFVEVGKPAID